MEETAVVGETCDASGPVVLGCAQRRLSSCGAGHCFAVAFVSTTILTLKYPDVSIFYVLTSQKQISGAGKHLV